MTDPKQAEIDYPAAIGEEGRAWLRNKPFHHDPRMTSRLLIDFGHILQILDLHAGMSVVELGCGSGWMTRFAARHGLDAHGYDISPEMIAIARELADQEGTQATFEVADMESLDLERRFDAALLYDALHHSRRAGQPSTPGLDPVFLALNPGALPARERSPAELYAWVRREEQYATLGANVVVELYSESHARKPNTRA